MDAEREYCPVHEAIQVLQEKWTMHIVRALLEGPLGFNELGRAVGGCNPATLKVRLDHLEDLGLLRRTVHSQMPPRTSYELAPAGVDDASQRVVGRVDGERDLPGAAAHALAEPARLLHSDMARRRLEKDEAHHVGAGVERRVEGVRGGQAADFDED